MAPTPSRWPPALTVRAPPLLISLARSLLSLSLYLQCPVSSSSRDRSFAHSQQHQIATLQLIFCALHSRSLSLSLRVLFVWYCVGHLPMYVCFAALLCFFCVVFVAVVEVELGFPMYACVILLPFPPIFIFSLFLISLQTATTRMVSYSAKGFPTSPSPREDECNDWIASYTVHRSSQ